MQKSISIRGFTLIELLVVIAIIAILAAILFPVFAKAREKARQTTCESNQKQLTLCILQYAQDYDELFPARYNAGGGGYPPADYWFEVIYPYVKSKGVYACPSEPTGNNISPISDAYTADGVWNVSAASTDRLNYAYNQNVGLNITGLSQAKIPSPANVLMLWDVDVANPESPQSAANDMNRPGFLTGTPRHTGGENYAFVDGHVKWFNRMSLPASDIRFTIN